MSKRSAPRRPGEPNPKLRAMLDQPGVQAYLEAELRRAREGGGKPGKTAEEILAMIGDEPGVETRPRR